MKLNAASIAEKRLRLDFFLITKNILALRCCLLNFQIRRFRHNSHYFVLKSRYIQSFRIFSPSSIFKITLLSQAIN